VTSPDPALAPLALIVAVARNGVIGKGGALPWHVSEDLKHFKKTTSGHVIIMGRKTHDSIGRALPKRRNIVVTRQPGALFAGCETAHSLAEAIALARTTDDCPFIIGGASLYEEALPLATELHLTSRWGNTGGRVQGPAAQSPHTARTPSLTLALTLPLTGGGGRAV